MRYHEIEIENISEPEIKECIEIFDQELKVLLNKTPELQDILIHKYSKNMQNQADICMNISKQAATASIALTESFFDDYCYSTRKERDVILQKTLQQIQTLLK